MCLCLYVFIVLFFIWQFFFCLLVLSYSGLFIFSYSYHNHHLDASFFLMRENKKAYGFEWVEGEKYLGGVGEGEIAIR